MQCPLRTAVIELSVGALWLGPEKQAEPVLSNDLEGTEVN